MTRLAVLTFDEPEFEPSYADGDPARPERPATHRPRCDAL